MDNLDYLSETDNVDYEMIDGDIYMMARPTSEHMQIEGNIFHSFKTYLKGKRCIPMHETDVFFNKSTNVVPDVMIICNPEIIKSRGIFGTPDLIVEIASPSTVKFDRMKKFETYEKYGVKEYWIVHPQSKSVEVYLRKDDKLVLDNIYYRYNDYGEEITEEEKDLIQHEIKVSLYEDFYVKLEDIFEYID